MSDPSVASETPRVAAGFSVLILTLNADRDLPLCLASVANCDDIVVLDSGSTDRTVEIAQAAGARIFVRPFDNFASQRNYAQRQISFRHPWVFHLDADEKMTPELILECGGAMVERNVEGFFAAPKVFWDERWLRHSTDFRNPEARFVRAPEFEFVESGHTQRAASQMRMGQLHTCYLHDPSRGGDDEWLARHRQHAQADARHLLASGHTARYLIPGRALWRFFQQYVLRRGFLDGLPGLLYCWLLAHYETFKQEELRRLRRGER